MCFSYDFPVICKATSHMQWFNPLPRTLQNPRTDTSSEQSLFLKLEASVGLWVLIARGSPPDSCQPGFWSDVALLWQAALLTSWPLESSLSWRPGFLTETRLDFDSRLTRTQRSFLVQLQPGTRRGFSDGVQAQPRGG